MASRDSGRKSCSDDLSHMTNIATPRINDKTLKDFFYPELTHGLETWFVALGTGWGVGYPGKVCPPGGGGGGGTVHGWLAPWGQAV